MKTIMIKEKAYVATPDMAANTLELVGNSVSPRTIYATEKDGTICMQRMEYATKEELEEAVGQLQSSGCKVYYKP